MSMAERSRHSNVNHKESRARSRSRKYSMKKETTVINHIDYERHHGGESTRAHPQREGESFVESQLNRDNQTPD